MTRYFVLMAVVTMVRLSVFGKEETAQTPDALHGHSPSDNGGKPVACRLVKEDGVPLKIVVAPGASTTVRTAAATLADYLNRISGVPFAVVEGDGRDGVVVGVRDDFPDLAPDVSFSSTDPFRREEYLLRSREGRLLVLGATPMAVENAVWDLLERLGYRQYFPGKTWEIVPSDSSPKIAVNVVEKPDFPCRKIWYGFGFWAYNIKPYEDWCVRNRARMGFQYSSRHIYQEIVRSRRAEFDAHPEYFALIEGKRRIVGGPLKFCISNPNLRALVVDWALDYLRKRPQEDTVPMEPSDGVGWCECPECAGLGSVTDRALLLANHVAEAVSREMPGKHVGMNAYSMHSPPPGIRVHPLVLIKVQNGFIRGGYTFDQLMTGWRAKDAAFGVGEYYSVFTWDKSRPANQKGSDLAYIVESIPRIHRQGARFYFAESSDLWGAVGLGHYLAAKLLWDVSDAERINVILDDFFVRAFGPARIPMERFFRRIYRFSETDRRPLIRGDLVARLYRDLAESYPLADGDPDILERLDDLLLLTRYEELFQKYEAASGAERQSAFEELLWHAWRMRETMMIHSKAIVRNLADQDRGVKQPPILKTHPNRPDLLGLPNPTQKPFDPLAEITEEPSPPRNAGIPDLRPYDRAEKKAMLEAGIAGNAIVEIGFEPVSFSRELVPATPLHLPETEYGDFNARAPIRNQIYYTWRAETDPKEFHFAVSGGHIEHTRKIAGPVQIRLFADANPILDEPVATDNTVPPDGQTREITFRSPFSGLHRIEAFQQTNRAIIDTVDKSLPLTLPAGLDEDNRLSGPWNLYFYVPRGTSVVGGFASDGRQGHIRDGSGKAVFSFSDMDIPGFFAAPVPPGQDGKLWKFEKCDGRRVLLTVPPFMARNASELLLPREVVEKDSRISESNNREGSR